RFAGFLLNERPDFINLQIPRSQIAHSGIHQADTALTSNDEKPHNRVPIQAGESFGAADGTTFDETLNRTRCRFRRAAHRVPRQFSVGFAESGFTGIAAPSLNPAL